MWLSCPSMVAQLPGRSFDSSFRRGSPSSRAPSFLLMSGLLIFSPLLEGGTTHLAVMIIRLTVLLMLGVYVARGIRNGAFTVPSLRIGPPALAYLGLAAFSTAISPYSHQSLQWLVVLLGYATLLYLLVCFIEGWDHIARLLAVLVGMGLFETGWALVQGGWFGATRPTGTFFNPNFLAGYLAAVWTIVLGSLCYVRLRWKQGRRAKGVHLTDLTNVMVPIAILGLLLFAIVWTSSRGGILALVVGTILVLGFRFGLKGLGLIALLLLVGLLVPNPLRERLWVEHVANPVGYARWQMWQSAVREMRDHPAGIGLGLYQYMVPRYMFPVEGQIARYGKVAQTPHNEYLQMGVELGAASVLIFGWGLVLMVREATGVLRQRLRRWQRGVVLGVSGAMAAILVHAAVDSNLHEPAIAILLTLCAGLVLSARRLTGRVAEPPRVVCLPTHRSRLLCAGLGLLVVGLLAVHVVRLGLAWMVHESGSRTAARLYFPLRAAIALNPLDGRLLGLLGHVYASLASATTAPGVQSGVQGAQRMVWLRGAVSAYERAVALEPFAPFYRLELGRLSLALGDRETAEAHVRRAIELEPNFLPGREWLARLYLQSERIDEAGREYREILERQQRYADWNKNDFEERFMTADVTALAAELKRATPRT
ncbi:MAG: tetratricopeptide repeat protein [Nitrospirae bacterium]|nr:MAG: tetratricopeptide repeat protein [Nitrospirota bacterium]